MTAPDYAARAAAGAAFLDGQVPGWAGQVDLATLDLADSCDCVLGQLGGSFQDTVEDLHLSQDDAVDLGFTIPPDESYHRWAELDAAWAREIVTRREAAGVTA